MRTALETPPLLPIHDTESSEGHLDDHFGEHLIYIIENKEFADPLKVVRRSAKGGTFVLIVAAKVSFWATSQSLGKVLGPITAVSNALAFSTLEIWAANEMFEDELGSRAQALLKMYPNEKRYWKKIAVIPFAFCIAASAQLSAALAVAKYNSSHFKIAAVIATTVSGLIVPMRSMQLSWQVITQKAQNKIERKLAKIKQEVQKLILDNRSAIRREPIQGLISCLKSIHTNDNWKTEYRKKLFEIESLSEESSFGFEWIAPLSEGEVEDSQFDEENTLLVHEKREKERKIFTQPLEDQVRRVGEGIGLVLTGVLELSSGYYAYQLSKEEVSDSDVFAAVLATTTVASNIYLIGTSLQKTTGHFFRFVYQAVTRTSTPSLMGQLSPKLMFVTRAIGMMIDLLGIGTHVVIWSDFYDRNEAEQYSLTTLICASIFMFLFTAMLESIDEILDFFVTKTGDAEERECIALNRKLRQLHSSLEKVPFVNFAAFILGCPLETRNALLEKFDLQLAEVEEYIRERTRS